MSTVKITAAEVKKLRDATGAGMMDCKKALVEAEGNYEAAIEYLRKKGQKVAAKRADRDTTEGAAIAIVNENATSGAVISLNCETDFVAMNDDFVALAKNLAKLALNFQTREAFLSADYEGMSVAEKLVEQTGVIGEKVEIGGFERLDAAFVGSYIHVGNKIASLVGFSDKVNNAEVLGKDLAMQAAAMGATSLTYKDFDPAYVASETEARIAAIVKENIELGRLGKTLKNVPQFISMAQLSDAVLSEAEDVAKAQLKAEGKPEQIWDRILPGKMERFVADNTTLDMEQCLLDQEFIKDAKKSVGDYVKTYGDVSVTEFKRVSLA